jgi:hypothetical protein
MRKNLSILVCFMLAFLGCKDKKNEPSQPSVNVVFHTLVNGQEVQPGVAYNRSGGETFQIDLMKYYISHCALVNSAGDSLMLNEHTLIDPINKNKEFTLSKGDLGSFQSMRFLFGVDELHNHSGNQEGDLDPVNGMIWTWSTGYIFYKHEGTFLDSLGNSQPLLYHFGSDRALVSVEMPITIQLKNDFQYEIHVHFNLDSFYSGIMFTDNNIHQSAGTADNPWIDALKANLISSFEVNEVKVNAMVSE